MAVTQGLENVELRERVQTVDKQTTSALLKQAILPECSCWIVPCEYRTSLGSNSFSPWPANALIFP